MKAFKNATFYSAKIGKLEAETLKDYKIGELYPSDLTRIGFDHVIDNELTVKVDDYKFVKVVLAKKVIPKSAINEAVKDAVNLKYKDRKPTKLEVKYEKELVIPMLAEVALVAREEVLVAHNEKSGLLIIDTASQSKAGDITALLRKAGLSISGARINDGNDLVRVIDGKIDGVYFLHGGKFDRHGSAVTMSPYCEIEAQSLLEAGFRPVKVNAETEKLSFTLSKDCVFSSIKCGFKAFEEAEGDLLTTLFLQVTEIEAVFNAIEAAASKEKQ